MLLPGPAPRTGLNPFTTIPMKRLLLALCVAFVAAGRLAAAPLTADELKRATAHLEKTKTAFLAAVEGLSPAQQTFKAGPTRWSVAECAEHIASAEDMLMGLVQTQVMKAGPRTETVNLQEIDDLVVNAIADRTKKATAPEPLIPNNRFGSLKDSVEHFKTSRAKTITFLKDTKDLRDHAFDSPLGKKLDGYQWLLFLSAHTERHTKQILEVKADANFPKK